MALVGEACFVSDVGQTLGAFPQALRGLAQALLQQVFVGRQAELLAEQPVDQARAAPGQARQRRQPNDFGGMRFEPVAHGDQPRGGRRRVSRVVGSERLLQRDQASVDSQRIGAMLTTR